MIMDGLLLFSNGQTVSAAGATASSNILDFGAAEDLGITERPTQVFVDWQTLPLGSSVGTTTVQVALQASATGTGGWTTVTQTAAILTNGIPNGAQNVLDLSQGMQRYAQLVYTVAAGSLTAGSVTAGLVLDSDGGQKYYPRRYAA